jgi:hypothetical protein
LYDYIVKVFVQQKDTIESYATSVADGGREAPVRGAP